MKIRFTLVLTIFFLRMISQVNSGFELSTAGTQTTINGWTLSKGTLTSFTSSGICQTMSPLPPPPLIKIVSTPYAVPLTSDYQEFDMAMVPASPFTGNNVAELNSSNLVQNNTGSIRMEQSFSITSANQILQYAYCVAMKSIYHPCCQSQYNLIQLYDCNGSLIPAASTTLVPLPTATQTGCFNTATLGLSLGTGTSSPFLNTLYTPGWLIQSYNLAAYVGSCVKLRAESGTCNATGHNGLFFFDAETHPSAFFVGNATITGSNHVVCNSSSTTLSAIPASSYSWSGPGALSGSSQNFTTTTAGVYSLTIGNAGGVPAFTQTFNLIFATTPSVQITASSHTICAGQTITLSANGSGITNYSWFNGNNTQSTTVSPTVSSAYGFTANTGMCPASAIANIFVSNCLNVSENSLQTAPFSIYPNPGKGLFTLQSGANQSIAVTNIQGQVLSEFETGTNT